MSHTVPHMPFAVPGHHCERRENALLSGGVRIALQVALEGGRRTRALGRAQLLVFHVLGDGPGLLRPLVAAEERLHLIPVFGREHALEHRGLERFIGLGLVGVLGIVVYEARQIQLFTARHGLIQEKTLKALGGGGGPLAR